MLTKKNVEKIEKKSKEQLEVFLKECGIEKKEGNLLEIGFKNGYFLENARKEGFNVHGTEISEQYFNETKKCFPEINIALEKNNKIPYEDNSMDFVVSFQVLEHVSSLNELIKEIYRVLKPGGVMYHVCPNYNSFYEGHYNVIWFPFLGKKTGRLYLKLLGKYGKYYETLNIIKPSSVKKKLLNMNFEVKSLGKKEFKNNFNFNQIRKIQVNAIRKACHFFLQVNLFKKIFLSTLTFLNLYYPIKVIAKKR